MAELQYYALSSELGAPIRPLLDAGFRIIPERPVLSTPTLETYATYSPAIEESLRTYRSALIEGSFTKHPLEFGRRRSGEASGTYYVELLSGPRIRWIVPGIDGSRLAAGSISYGKGYRDPATGRWEAPSEELKDGFKRVLDVIKRELVRISLRAGERVWVSKAAKEAIDRGEVKLER